MDALCCLSVSSRSERIKVESGSPASPDFVPTVTVVFESKKAALCRHTRWPARFCFARLLQAVLSYRIPLASRPAGSRKVRTKQRVPLTVTASLDHALVARIECWWCTRLPAMPLRVASAVISATSDCVPVPAGHRLTHCCSGTIGGPLRRVALCNGLKRCAGRASGQSCAACIRDRREPSCQQRNRRRGER